jgi:Spy/CpxP family protein refolding chaperone
MRRVVTAMLGTAAVVLMATSVYAQAPNFAGKWTPDAEKNAAMNPNAGGGGRGGGRGGGMGGGEVTIAQDAKTLTVKRTTQAGEMKLTYNLDGSPSKNMAMGRGGQTEVTSTAKWDGAKLVITSDNGQSITYAMDGAWLVQSTTSPGRGGGDPVTRSTYYKKGM